MLGCGVNGNTLGCYPREWEFDPPRPSHFSGSRLDGKPPALGAGESEFDSRDPDLKWGLDVVGGMRVLQTRRMGSRPIVSTILLPWPNGSGASFLNSSMQVRVLPAAW
jgi:hypothetical protein